MMLYCTVVITDLYGYDHDIEPNSDAGNEALSLVLSKHEAKSFSFMVKDTDVAVRGWLKKGCIARFYCDSNSTPTTLVLAAMVEDIVRVQRSQNLLTLKVSGREYSYVRILERIAVEVYENMATSEILRSLLAKYLPHPATLAFGFSLYEGSGTTIHDESVYATTGTLYDCSWDTDAVHGGCLSFDADAEHVIVLNSSVLEYMKEMTVACWVKPSVVGDVYRLLMQRLAEEISGWIFYINGDSSPTARARCYYDSETYIEAISDEVLTVDEWVFLAFTYDGTTLILYINGEPQAITDTGTIPVGNNADIYFSSTGTNGIRGLLAKPAIWSKKLTAQQIKDIYHHGYVHNINPVSDAVIPEIRYAYRYIKDVFDGLKNISGSHYYFSQTNCLRWGSPTTVDSGINYSDTDILEMPTALDSLIPIKNRVYVLGGIRQELDQSITETSETAVYSKDYWWAQSFTPERSELTQISLYIKRTGTLDNLSGGIYTDDGAGKPGNRIAGFQFDAEYIGTSVGWKPIKVNASLMAGQTYWIVLEKIGDVDNVYAWYADESSDNTLCYSADGLTWSQNASTVNLCFKTYYGTRILTVKQDATKVGDYEWREAVLRDDAILDRVTANAYAQAKLDELTEETEDLSEITILKPTAIPADNSYVGIAFDIMDLTADYDVEQATLSWSSGVEGTDTILLKVGKHKGNLGDYIAKMKVDLEHAKLADLGIDTPVDLIRTLSDTYTISVSEAIVATENTKTDYITDEFDNLDDWSAGSLISGNLVLAGAQGSEITSTYTGAASLPDDYYAEVEAKCTVNEGSYIGIRMREDGDGSDYIQVHFSPYYNYVRIRKVVAFVGTTLSIIYNTPYGTTKDTYYKLKVYQRDSGADWICTVWLDDYEVVEYTDSPRQVEGSTRFKLNCYNYQAGCLKHFNYCNVWTQV